MGYFHDKKLKKLHFEVLKARAARAIYPQVRGMLPKIQLTFETYDGKLIELELDHEITSTFMSQVESAYEATMPSRSRKNRYFDN